MPLAAKRVLDGVCALSLKLVFRNHESSPRQQTKKDGKGETEIPTNSLQITTPIGTTRKDQEDSPSRLLPPRWPVRRRCQITCLKTPVWPAFR